MQFFKPTPYLEYTPPKLAQGKEWYIHFAVRNPQTGQMVRIRKKLNRIKSVKERREAAKIIIARLTEQLALGWNPLMEKIAPKAYMKLYDAMDNFLKVKTKEIESGSLRAYRSYVKIMKNWLRGCGMDENFYACSFTEAMAVDFMNDVEDDENISARTFNNYKAFYTIMWNWFIEKKYISSNPFNNIKKKPKKLTKKKRRTFTDDEVRRLIDFLKKENNNYLVMCLLCYCCFMRPKEIALLKCADVDLRRQLVHVSDKIAKNDNESYRTIPDSMMKYVAKLNLSNPDAYLFSELRTFRPGKKLMCSREISRYWNMVIRPSCDFPMELQFYSLKDTGITNMANRGIPLNFVKQQADHSSIAMTAVYMGNSRDKATEELKGVDIIDI